MSYNPFSLEGKTILVTGASSGIGRATAIECSKMGARVILTARNKERLEETYRSLVGDGHSYYTCDLSIPEEIDDLVSKVPEIQGLVNNAGFTKISPIQFIKGDDFQRLIDINLKAPVFLFQKLLKKKKLGRDSSVVFTSSMAGLGNTSVGNGMYTATKGAISAFIRTAAKEFAPKNIRVNAVCPAMVNTGILDSGTISEEQKAESMKSYPLGRWARPEEIAWAFVYLLSDASTFITGTNLEIDGGRSLI